MNNQQPNWQSTPPPNNNKGLKGIIIACICVLAILLIVLISLLFQNKYPKIFYQLAGKTPSTETTDNPKNDVPNSGIPGKYDGNETANDTSGNQNNQNNQAANGTSNMKEMPVQTVYCDTSGKPIYLETRSYYDNGLLCTSTVQSVHYYNPDYPEISPEYTFLYLYDQNGNLKEEIFDVMMKKANYNESTKELVLETVYHDNGDWTDTVINPETESIEQEKFGVDPTKTKTVYETVSLIPSKATSNWASTYLNSVLDSIKIYDNTTLSLCFVDDNDLPELIVDYGFNAAGSEMYTIGNHRFNRLQLDNASWIERTGKIHSGGGKMDVYYDDIYQLKDGKFVHVDQGNYGGSINANGEENYRYYWNEIEMSKKEYEDYHDSVFDRDKAINVSRHTLTYNQCKALLESIEENS